MCVTDFTRQNEKLPVEIFSKADAAAEKIASRIEDTIRKNDDEGRKTVLGISESSSCSAVLDSLVCAHKNRGLSFRNVVVYSLSEYYGIHPDELQSHSRFLREYLVNHVDIAEGNVHFIDSFIPRDKVNAYCQMVEQQIASDGGFDILLLSNMGFNEPGSHVNSKTRLITLNHTTKLSVASDFFGVNYVPNQAITLGISTLLYSKEIMFLAWGEGKVSLVKNLVEGSVTDQIPVSFLQNHKNITVYADTAAASGLTRIDTPWLVGECEWTDYLTKKAVFWLSEKLSKPILKITERDYNDNGMSSLISHVGSAYELNIRIFNNLQHIITGWPGGKPNADDSTRPERALPYPKRVIVFSPHPDDDVISMGGTVARLSSQGHLVHLAYQVSGNIAVFDHDVIKYMDFMREASRIYHGNFSKWDGVYAKIERDLASKHPGEADPMEVREIKSAIRRGEAKSACRYLGIPEERVHFLNLPFYDTGGVKKAPLTQKDVDIIKNLLQEVRPHQIFAAGDLTDPHGTHRVCLMAILAALKELAGEEWMKDCRVWLYRGAWQEWDIAQADMAVPLSPAEAEIKKEAIFRHQSQKDHPLFPGSDMREFWQRAEERNHQTAVKFDNLGMAEYQAIELFVRYRLENEND